jgi:hypothetical protein
MEEDLLEFWVVVPSLNKQVFDKAVLPEDGPVDVSLSCLDNREVLVGVIVEMEGDMSSPSVYHSERGRRSDEIRTKATARARGKRSVTPYGRPIEGLELSNELIVVKARINTDGEITKGMVIDEERWNV